MSLDLLIGPMFAGKSSRILSIVSRYSSLGVPVLVIKHASDTRYGEDDMLVTHDQRRVPCIRLQSLNELPDGDIPRYQVILVDEAQFFDGLVPFVHRVVERYRRNLFLIGLDGDSQRQPFGELLQCIPLADRVERLTSLCRRCADGTPGLFSYRIPDVPDQQVIIGGQELYQPLCRWCYLRQPR